MTARLIQLFDGEDPWAGADQLDVGCPEVLVREAFVQRADLGRAAMRIGAGQ